MTSQNPYPGQEYPTMSPPPQGSVGSSVYNKASGLQALSTSKQVAINNTGGYKRRRNSRRRSKKIRGGGVVVAVPVTSYPEQGTTTIASVTTSATANSIGQTANKQYDACIGQPASCTSNAKVGGKNNKRGGVKWGCMRGG